MVRNNPKKQFILFLIGCAINVLLFILAKYTRMPLWLDYTGSIYITVMCGPVYAFASVFLHTALLALLIDGPTALLVAVPMLLVCVIFFVFDKNGLTSHLDGVAAAFISIIAAFISMSLITLICGALPARYAPLSYLYEAVASESGRLFAAITVASVVAFTEVLVSILLFALIWLITPRAKDNMIFKK